ncbi:phosphatase PAP2 family protein [Bradyrhizobium sp. U531]|uniref:phosphatase PAP2 family protein n=1 Tax=Bradyrhizobium sp. U531 TaxID=3053458 RepID=UPI003F6830B9
MKSVFNQTRPDRRTVLGHVHGVSFSGKREDAFPSGHALHMGALASAAGTLPRWPRRAIQLLAVGLSSRGSSCWRGGRATWSRASPSAP